MYHLKTVILVLSVVVLAQVAFCDVPIDYSSEMTPSNTYDYIIVGVGQSGSVAAARIAENGTFRVLGIDAGNRTHRSLNGTDYVASDFTIDSTGKVIINTPWTRFDVPIFTGSISSVTPPPYPELTAILNGVETNIHVGKLLGGSAAHNGEIWLRQTKKAINDWGIDGWSYDQVLPFYKKSENVSASSTASFPFYHGFTGPIQISDTPNNTLYSAVPLLIQACVNLGYPYNPDFNGASRYGCGKQVFDIGHGVRSSAANAYLPNAIKKGNLFLELNAHVSRILIKAGSPNPIAYGVEYVQNNHTKRVFASKEIIVSLSAVFTPQMLMLSGIGPAKDLTALGIHVWVNNSNVGQNLRVNQITVGANQYPNANYGSAFRVSDYSTEYAYSNTGPWMHPGQYAYAYVCSYNTTNCTEPDVMVGFQAGGFFGSGGGVAGTIQIPTLATQVSNAAPKLSGTLRLIANNSNALVNITIDAYAHHEDLNAQVFGWRLIRGILGTYPVTTFIGPEISPGSDLQTYEQLASFVKGSTPLYYHWVGSAKMGNTGDNTRVTDPKQRVVGVTGLRVGDPSVLPTVTSHLQASAAMTGERVADFILNP